MNVMKSQLAGKICPVGGQILPAGRQKTRQVARVPRGAQIPGMKVRLTHKFSELINGVDLSHAKKGDTLDLPDRDARTLIAEGWAVYEPVRAGRDRAHDKPARRRLLRKKKR